MPCYLVVQEITELQEDVTKQTGDSKQSFYNNIDTDNIEIRQIYYIVSITRYQSRYNKIFSGTPQQFSSNIKVVCDVTSHGAIYKASNGAEWSSVVFVFKNSRSFRVYSSVCEPF